jgi:NAD(P)H-hydrate epimerase
LDFGFWILDFGFWILDRGCAAPSQLRGRMSIAYKSPQAMSCGAIRDVDRYAIESLGIPGIVLMENAARSVAEIVNEMLPAPAGRVLVLCGSGNNGGDGFVVARLLSIAGVRVTVALADPPSAADAVTNFRIVERMGIAFLDGRTTEGLAAARAAASEADVIVDALLGTGARGAPRGPVAELIRIANAAPGRRVAVDIPSGLDGDSGVAAEPCFRADTTVTFVAEKTGFATAAARAVTGRISVVGIGSPLPPELAAGKP